MTFPLDPRNDNAPATALQAAFATHWAPTPREQALLLTRGAYARTLRQGPRNVAPATPGATRPTRPLPPLTPARLRA